ncbi:hypothetical protein CI665_005290 [Klebsiella quasipneumoniae subsp. similipneumoniae]|uniref:Uncharacterized protein n=1 Tax=Klebsiella quasipneumoniae TaxID=1463165 RepID=A0AAI8NMF1_9ENTR|nr:hypothetical protein AL473_25625 [Klebsiella quasipneumoniae]AVO80490.1 hypothetical protein AM459_22005 [Klebsiella pneumoniae]AWB63824.1 hypothetical protein CUC76_20670 [Enterobacteriaceae bacterium S05]AWO62397.1 hypothetical protein DLJ73_15780 [Klebsiella quasipneumoniae subsp. similipneumoniae]AWX86074.1 hypothetical protein DP204_05395 [Klebsiella quasipneumoniae subsp. quasipneumoniae]
MRSTFGNALSAFRSSTDIRTSFACFAGRHCVCPAYGFYRPGSLRATGHQDVTPRNRGLDRAPGE